MGHYIDKTIHTQEVDALLKYLDSRDLTNIEAVQLLQHMAEQINMHGILNIMDEKIKRKG